MYNQIAIPVPHETHAVPLQYSIPHSAKIANEMRIVYITESKPKRRIRLDPLDNETLNIDLAVVTQWSPNNKELYELLLSNGMAEFICNREFLN
jgi:hypothetical protein